jgi:hypothetical protein
MLWSHWPVCDRVLVNLLDGSAINGVLVDKRGPLLVLADAALIPAGSREPQPMDGQVFIERPQIAFIQAISAKGG